MRCIVCGVLPAAQSEETCTVCAARAEREVAELVGDTPVEQWRFGDTTVAIKGLPPRTRLEDTCAEQPDKPIADALVYAPDVEREFLLRHAGGGGM